MSDVTTIALSGMQAAGLRLAVDANNIANVNSEGFTPSRVRQSSLPDGGTSARLEPAPALRGDLVTPLIDQLGARYAFEANAVVLRTQLDAVGHLLDVRA